MFNNFVINPAIAGTKPCTDSRLGYRNQWLGFTGNPTSAYASAHMLIKTRKTGYRKVKHGIGSYVENDQTGPSARNALMAAYAIHIPVASRTYFSAGIFAGFTQYSFNNRYFKYGDYSDPALAKGGNTFLVPDLSPGVYLYNPKFYAGLSVKSVLGNKIKSMAPGNKLSRHYYLTAGRRIELSDRKSAFMPAIGIRFAPYAPLSVDLTMIYDVKSRLLLGLSYRGIRGGSAAVGFFKIILTKRIDLGYAYDYPLSKIKLVTIQTHEVLLGFKICNTPEKPSGDVSCPAYQ